uniref:C2 domain-containing protein n=1 Tax=Rhizophagus irregularis (strain DAOM 181602 / DAOM 197198 / MUCL 43194) TaxID=747089 RepID=U9TD19_RHIID
MSSMSITNENDSIVIESPPQPNPVKHTKEDVSKPVSAKILNNWLDGDSLNFYVKITCLSSGFEFCKTHICNDINPEWNQEFYIPIYDIDKKFKIRVYNNNAFFNHMDDEKVKSLHNDIWGTVLTTALLKILYTDHVMWTNSFKEAEVYLKKIVTDTKQLYGLAENFANDHFKINEEEVLELSWASWIGEAAIDSIFKNATVSDQEVKITSIYQCGEEIEITVPEIQNNGEQSKMVKNEEKPTIIVRKQKKKDPQCEKESHAYCHQNQEKSVTEEEYIKVIKTQTEDGLFDIFKQITDDLGITTNEIFHE